MLKRLSPAMRVRSSLTALMSSAAICIPALSSSGSWIVSSLAKLPLGYLYSGTAKSNAISNVSELAAKYGASTREETHDPREAYAGSPETLKAKPTWPPA